MYWGWGAEDDDLQRRLTKGLHFPIIRPDGRIARYTMYGHEHEESNSKDHLPDNRLSLQNWNETWKRSGLSNLNYNVMSIEQNKLFHKFTVDIGDKQKKKTPVVSDEKNNSL